MERMYYMYWTMIYLVGVKFHKLTLRMTLFRWNTSGKLDTCKCKLSQ